MGGRVHLCTSVCLLSLPACTAHPRNPLAPRSQAWPELVKQLALLGTLCARAELGTGRTLIVGELKGEGMDKLGGELSCTAP